VKEDMKKLSELYGYLLFKCIFNKAQLLSKLCYRVSPVLNAAMRQQNGVHSVNLFGIARVNAKKKIGASIKNYAKKYKLSQNSKK